MKKVLFFIDHNWVFGKIHNELIKALYPEFYCDLKSWSVSMTLEEGNLFKDKYDLFVSTPEGCRVLHDSYNIPFNKLVGTVHADYDIYTCLNVNCDNDFFDKLGGYSVIWPDGQKMSLSLGVRRLPKVVPVGLFNAFYPKKDVTTPRRIGYFGKFNRFDQKYKFDIKRGFLVQQVAERCGLEFHIENNVNFLVADQLYKSPDIVMFSSLMEGNPYPALEGFASGIPVLGTNTGIFPDYVRSGGGGVILPFEEGAYVEKAVEIIEKWKTDPDEYRKVCNESMAVGEKIDWKFIRKFWVDFFNEVLEKQ